MLLDTKVVKKTFVVVMILGDDGIMLRDIRQEVIIDQDLRLVVAHDNKSHRESRWIVVHQPIREGGPAAIEKSGRCQFLCVLRPP